MIMTMKNGLLPCIKKFYQVSIFSILCFIGLFLPQKAYSCGPDLFYNEDLDSLSLLEPTLISDVWLTPFYSYASPAYGLDVSEHQGVIHPTSVSIRNWDYQTNLADATSPEYDILTTQANEADWLDYFKKNGQKITLEQLQSLLYEKKIPGGLTLEQRAYFKLLESNEPDSPSLGDEAVKRAKDKSISSYLRERYAFLGIRSACMSSDPLGLKLFQELTTVLNPGSLCYYRSLSWRAKVELDQGMTMQALADYLKVFDQSWDLRVIAFQSLGYFKNEDWVKYIQEETNPARKASAVFACFLLQERDFSPQTLQSMLDSQPSGSKTLFVFYHMLETIEQEAGMTRFINLVSNHDPKLKLKKKADQNKLISISQTGQYTDLYQVAYKASHRKDVYEPKVWLQLCAYLAYLNGDLNNLKTLYQESLGYVSTSPVQEKWSHLLGTLVNLSEQTQDAWDSALQARYVEDLKWSMSLNQPDNNRGLYHTLVVLAAQKYLSLGRIDAAARAFGALQKGKETLFTLSKDDWFWTCGWGSNTPVNFLFDVLLEPKNIQDWKGFLKTPEAQRLPLDNYLASEDWLTPADLNYLEAYKYLRRSQPELAIGLLNQLNNQGYFNGDKTWNQDRSILSVRSFSYSFDVDPVYIESDLTKRKVVSLLDLAIEMNKLETLLKTDPSAKNYYLAGNFYFSLQLAGFPLLFSNPPKQISYTRNYELYSYDGTDDPDAIRTDNTEEEEGLGDPVSEYPLFLPEKTEKYREQFIQFNRQDFSFTHRAEFYYEKSLIGNKDAESQFSSWVMLKNLTGKNPDIIKGEYKKTPLYQIIQSTCEGYSE